MDQLLLDLGGPRRATAENFVDGDAYRDARVLLAEPERWPRGGLVLHGPASSGKSHLAALWAQSRGAPLFDAGALDERVLGRASRAPAIVVDGVAAAADERMLLHLINLAREEDAPVLMTARSPAARLDMTLPDLRSRLLAMGSAAIAPAPDDVLARSLLARRLRDAGVKTTPEVIAYVLARMERSFAAIDRAAHGAAFLTLREKKGLTKPLAGEILDQLDPPS